jgi:hypothetical protein
MKKFQKINDLTFQFTPKRVFVFLTALLLSGGAFATDLYSVLAGSSYNLPGGMFETPVLPASPGYQYAVTGSGWTMSARAGLSRNNTAFTSGNPNAPEGSQVLFLQIDGTASQSISFAAGYYTFSFFAAQRGNTPSTQTFQLRIDGTLLQSFTPSGTTYQAFNSASVLLSSGAHLIELRATNPLGGDNTVFIDDLKATRVKEQLVSGFESPIIITQPWYLYSPTGGPWTFSSGSGLTGNNTDFTAGNPPVPEGSQALFLQGNSTASTNVTIPHPGYYRFRFNAALRGNVPTTKNIRILIAGIKIGEFSLTSTLYKEKTSLAIYLNAGTQTLSLTGVDPIAGDHTGLVDNLRMEMLQDWQDPYVWNGTVPGINDNATIGIGSSVCIQGNVSCKSITVSGELLGVQNKNVNVNTKNIMIMGPGSLLEFGQDLTPYPGSAVFTLNATTADPDIMGMGKKFIGAMDNGTLQFHGKEKISWTQLGANASAGSTTITLKEAVNWQIGDIIVIVSSRTDWNEAEKRTITGISGAGTILTLNTSLSYPHTGVLKNYSNSSTSWTADLRAQVGVLSHNIKVQGDAASATNGFGGHIMIMNNSKAYVGGIELYNMGQKAILGRYPFHWHMLGNVGAGQYFKNSSIHQSYNRAITIHGTESTLVENNFFYDHIGHGVFLEDGSERFNVIRKNVTLLTKRPAVGEQLTPSDNQLDEVQNRTPSSYWITNPQNTFEDNVAAGTQGTGYWFIFPQHPMGLSASDPRFSMLEPHKLPMISFKGNSAHSTMNGFDIFDQLDSNHSIIRNLGWVNTNTHFIENCTWYANTLALYSGIGEGGPSNNLIFSKNIFVENVVATMFASYCIVDQSVFVASSGENLVNGQRYAYRVYDGAGQVRNSHFIGWNASNANFLLNAGAAIKHPNHIFTGNTISPAGTVRCELENFDIKQVVAHANYPAHPRYWSVVLRDITGDISGKTNTSIVSNHPFLLVGDEFRPSNWVNTYRSDHHFVLSRLNYGNLPFDQTPNIVCTREKAGTAPKSVYYIDGYKEWHQLPFLVNEGYEYTYTYESLPTLKTVQMNMEDATAGDYYIARFKDFGKLGGISISASQSNLTTHTSLNNLRNANSSGYYLETNGDLYIKAVATASNEYFTINWNTNFIVPVIDSDGDEMPDGAEMTAIRDPFKPGDLAAEFNTNNGSESWTGYYNVINQTVSGGSYSGTASGNDAQLVNNAYNFNARQVPHLFVSFKASQNDVVQLFFATNSLPGFSASRVVSAAYTGNGAYQTLDFNMGAHTDWNTIITDLRLDPVSITGSSFQIDWIRAGCQGTDTDSDGICNFADICPTLDDHLIGSSCNDGNDHTFPDNWSTNCNCVGIPIRTTDFTAEVLSDEKQVAIYPNPFFDQINIQLKETGIFKTIKLMDMQARIINETSIDPSVQTIEWNLQHLASGIYLFQFIGDNHYAQLKLVKQ